MARRRRRLDGPVPDPEELVSPRQPARPILASLPPSRERVDPLNRAVLRLQRAVGNAGVVRTLARQSAPPTVTPTGVEPVGERPLAPSVPDPEVENAVTPHGPGEDPDTKATLEKAEQEKEKERDAGAGRDTGPLKIGKAVGAGAANEAADVSVVGGRLKQLGFLDGAITDVNAVTTAIRNYQAQVLGWRKPDGRVDPAGKTLGALGAGKRGEVKSDPAGAAPPVPEAQSDKRPPGTVPDKAPPDAKTTSADQGKASAPSAPAGKADARLAAWAKEDPKTNPAVARWVLEGEGHGFITFASERHRGQIKAIAAGQPVLDTRDEQVLTKVRSGAGDPLVGILSTMMAMMKGRAERWVNDPSKGKQRIIAGDMARDLPGGDPHSNASSIDIGTLDTQGPKREVMPGEKRYRAGKKVFVYDFTSDAAVRDVIQTLEDLPKGKYRVGLPFQGKFFDLKDTLISRQKKAEREANGGSPADVTVPSLKEWTTHRVIAQWNPAKRAWVEKSARAKGEPDWPGQAFTGLKSEELKRKLTELKARGKIIYVFPDRPDHIHITRD